jgi:preprotein translocase SecF subunit
MFVNFKIDYIKLRKPSFIVSIALTVIGIISLLVFNLNYGVDFKAGTTLDISAGTQMDKAKVDALIHESFPEAKEVIITLGGNNERVTARFDMVLTEAESKTVISAFVGEYGEQVTYEENTVDVTIARELAVDAILIVLIASLFIALYMVIRFEWRFAVAGIVSVLHDAFLVVAVYCIFRIEVNLTFVAAILTVIGYSINDRIVIFDRIRENLPKAKLKNFDDVAKLANDSIAQVLTRTINTVLMVLFTAVALLIFGSESIRSFSFAISLGLVIGVYSSIFIACPMWVLLKNRSLSAKRAALIAAKEQE